MTPRRNNASLEQGRRPSPKSGFTLIELLVSLALFSIIIAAIGAVLVPLRRSFTTQEVAAGAQQTVRQAVEFMVNDIRMAGLDPLDEADAGIESASALLLRFTVDRILPGETEANGQIDEGNLERLTYAWDAPNQRVLLTRDAGTSSSLTDTLVDNVSNFLFRYFDEDGLVTTVAEDIRSVEISMTVEEPAGMDGMVARTYRTRVRCRNLGL